MFQFLLSMACYLHPIRAVSEVCEGCYGDSGFTAQKVIVCSLTKLINVIGIYAHLDELCGETILFHIYFLICCIIYRKYLFRTNKLQGCEDFPWESLSNNTDPDVRLFRFVVCGTANLQQGCGSTRTTPRRGQCVPRGTALRS